MSLDRPNARPAGAPPIAPGAVLADPGAGCRPSPGTLPERYRPPGSLLPDPDQLPEEERVMIESAINSRLSKRSSSMTPVTLTRSPTLIF